MDSVMKKLRQFIDINIQIGYYTTSIQEKKETMEFIKNENGPCKAYDDLLKEVDQQGIVVAKLTVTSTEIAKEIAKEYNKAEKEQKQEQEKVANTIAVLQQAERALTGQQVQVQQQVQQAERALTGQQQQPNKCPCICPCICGVHQPRQAPLQQTRSYPAPSAPPLIIFPEEQKQVPDPKYAVHHEGGIFLEPAVAQGNQGNNNVTVLADTAANVINHLHSKPDLDPSCMLVFEFDNCIGSLLCECFINGVLKYDQTRDPNGYVPVQSIQLLEQISYRVPIYIITKKNNEEMAKMVEFLKAFNILERVAIINTMTYKNTKELARKSDILVDILNGDPEIKHLIYVDSEDIDIAAITQTVKGVPRISSTIIKVNQIDDMKAEIVQQTKSEKAAEEFMYMRRLEYMTALSPGASSGAR